MATKPKKKKEVLYLHVDAKTKTWLIRLCKKQPGTVSLSTMAERIMLAAKQNPKMITAA